LRFAHLKGRVPDLTSRMNWQTGKSLTLCILLAGLAITAIFSRGAIAATAPEIELIEPYKTNMVLVHFDTDANRVYHLQRTSDLSGGMESTNWNDIYETPNLPFPNHYIIVDYCTNGQGFYRLKVTR